MENEQYSQNKERRFAEHRELRLGSRVTEASSCLNIKATHSHNNVFSKKENSKPKSFLEFLLNMSTYENTLITSFFSLKVTDLPKRGLKGSRDTKIGPKIGEYFF